MAYAWAKKLGTSYAQDPVFITNFLRDFGRLLPSEFQDLRIEEIDLSRIVQQIERDKSLSKEEKKRLSAERQVRRTGLKDRFGYAWVDGKRTEVANWMAEPPGLFIGRGNHPLRGRWKPRITRQDIILNLGEDAPLPEGSWADIVHDHDSTWLAKWVDKLTADTKYVWLSEASSLRRKRDKEKYDLAARLQDRIEAVRKLILKGMRSKDERDRKTASVCFLIDKLAMRVGDEKDEDEADTVGASTLRVEHVKIQDYQMHFDFLGKDSVRWQKTINLNRDDEDEISLINFRQFIQGKAPGDLLFDGINSSAVNRFLSKGMKGLTAKVFRTYEATTTVRQYLQRQRPLDGEGSLHLRLHHAKMANLEAAIRCNHKRTPPKNWAESLSKKEGILKRLLAGEAETPRQTERLKERIEKTQLSLDLTKATKDYNVGTSLRNYVDPRIYKSWADHVGLDWRLLYTKSLQKKFGWVGRVRLRWQPSG